MLLLFSISLLMKVMSMFKTVLVDTVAKTRTLPYIMLSFYFIVLHLLIIFILSLSLCFLRLRPEFLACLLCQGTSNFILHLACYMECVCFLDDVFLSVEQFPFSVGRLDFWWVTLLIEVCCCWLNSVTGTCWVYLWLLKLRNLYAGLTKYICARWDFFKDCFLLVEFNHWLRGGVGFVLCGTLTANYSLCHCSSQTDKNWVKLKRT